MRAMPAMSVLSIHWEHSLSEVLGMSCEAVNATNNGASGGKGRTIPLYFSTKRRKAILDASAYGKHGHSLREMPIFPIFRARDSHFRAG